MSGAAARTPTRMSGTRLVMATIAALVLVGPASGSLAAEAGPRLAAGRLGSAEPAQGHIHGVLRASDGTPIRNWVVNLYRSTAPHGPYWGDRTNSRGEFTIYPGAGTYVLQLSDTRGNPHGPPQWYGAWTDVGSTVIAVAPSGPGVELGIVEFRPGATVTGSVLRSGDGGLRGLYVELYDQQGHYTEGSTTDSTGHYAVNVAPGTYTVLYRDLWGGVVDQWYDHGATEAAATPLPLANGVVTQLPDVVPAPTDTRPEGTDLYGRVTGPDGQPEAGVKVCAKSTPVEPPSYECSSYAITDVFGRYALTKLDHASTGTTVDDFKIQLTRIGTFDADSTWLREAWSGGGSTYGEATAVHIPSDDTPGHQDLAMTASYAGIRGTFSSSTGNPPMQGKVHVDDVNGHEVRWISTDTDGRYAVPFMEPGNYRVWFEGEDEDASSPFLTSWWQDAGSLATATPVVLTAGAYTTLDPTLQEHLVPKTPPSIEGKPTVGATLQGDRGEWIQGDPTLVSGQQPTYVYTWLSNGSAVGTGPEYVVQPSDAGHAISFRVDADQLWSYQDHWTGTATSAAVQVPAGGVGPPPPPPVTPAVTSLASTMSVTPRVRQHPLRVTLRISVAAGGAPVSGAVSVREGSQSSFSGVLHNGMAVLVLRRMTPGRHTYTVTYTGADGVLPSKVAVKVRVKQPHSAS